jgi:STE24 endopeptidase
MLPNYKLLRMILCLSLFVVPLLTYASEINTVSEVDRTSEGNMVSAVDTTPFSEETYFNARQIEQGKAYTGTKRAIWFSSLLLTGITLMFLAFTQTGLRLRVALAIKANGREWLMTLMMISTIFVLLRLVKAPLAFFSSFTIPHRFEISNQSLEGWIGDYFLSSLINGVILIFTIMVLYKLMTVFKKRWWIVSAFFVSGGTILIFWLSPLVIAPLFNDFTPLENPELESKIHLLAEKALVPVDEILVINASKRTKALNAYYSGIGNTRRIVIYDNLLKELNNDEILSIIAHELGHWQKNHILKGLIAGCGGIFIALYAIYLLLAYCCSEKIFGLYTPSDPGTIPLLLLIVFVIQTVAIPPECILSRYFERQADEAALELTGDADSFINIEQKLAISNLSDITPPEWYVFLMHTHPPVMERIKTAVEYKMAQKKTAD